MIDGIIKESKWEKGNFVCTVFVENIGDLKFVLTPEQLSDMHSGYSQREIEYAFRVCYDWINVCDKGKNAEMLRECDIGINDFKKAKEVLDEFKGRKIRLSLEFV